MFWLCEKERSKYKSKKCKDKWNLFCWILGDMRVQCWKEKNYKPLKELVASLLQGITFSKAYFCDQKNKHRRLTWFLFEIHQSCVISYIFPSLHLLFLFFFTSYNDNANFAMQVLLVATPLNQIYEEISGIFGPVCPWKLYQTRICRVNLAVGPQPLR